MTTIYRILRRDDGSNQEIDASEDYDLIVEVFRTLRRVYPKRWYQIDESMQA